MPDDKGRFRGIRVPRIPWEEPREKPCPVCEGDGDVFENADLDSTGPVRVAECPNCYGDGADPEDPS